MEENLTVAVLQIPFPRVDCSDRLVWLGNKEGIFSVKSCYISSCDFSSTEASSQIWEKIWRVKIHERLKVFLWRMLVGALPTRSRVHQRLRVGEMLCPLCGMEEETEVHLFSRCEATRLVAFATGWGVKINGCVFTEVSDLVEFCVDPPRALWEDRISKNEATTFMSNLFFGIWKYRNEVVHTGWKEPVSLIEWLNLSMLEEFHVFEDPVVEAQRMEEHWLSPPDGWLKANTDAAFKDGYAALAVVVRNSQAEVVFVGTRLVKTNSPAVAEMLALEWGMRVAELHQWNNILWSADALNMVNEILFSKDPGGWETRLLVLSCRNFITSKNWKLTWNARSTNRAADQVAKQALHCSWSFWLYGVSCPALATDFVKAIALDQLSAGVVV